LAVLGWDYINIDFRAALDLLRDAASEAVDDDRMRMRCEHYLAGILDLLGEDFAEVGLHIRAMLEAAERLDDVAGLAGALGFVVQNEQRRTGHAPAELIERVRALEPAMRNEVPVLTWPTRGLAEMASWTDDLTAAIAQFDWFRQQALERGEETSRIIYTAELIVVECAAGEWQRALAHADEGLELTIAASQVAFQAITLAGRALAEAHLGDTQAARRDAGEALRLAAPRGVLLAERVAAWALGILELSLGDHVRAHEQLGPLVEGRRAAGVGEPGDMRFVTDEVEALIGLGQLTEAEAMLDWYEGLARASGRLFALAACDRCRGLLHTARGDHDAAIAALEASRDRCATIADPFGRARTLLALGTIQRRVLRRHAARATLEASLAAFEDLGARLWAGRARAELGRIGGRHAVGNELTPSERQVAGLVAEGRTNREVAAALYVTERTVEGHLSRIYAKFGVRSRAELAHRLAAGAEPRA
jgi:DNA-binding CsgD family transcriptional regulator